VVSDKTTWRFLREAEADFLEALRHYQERDPAVARRFDHLIRRVTTLIADSPERWPIRNGSRRYVLRRFPFTVAYLFDGGIVSIIAVAHHKRDPGSWEHRR
jgi:plasmid stabilization system protein ParE